LLDAGRGHRHWALMPPALLAILGQCYHARWRVAAAVAAGHRRETRGVAECSFDTE